MNLQDVMECIKQDIRLSFEWYLKEQIAVVFTVILNQIS